MSSEDERRRFEREGFTPWQQKAIRAELFGKPMPPNQGAPPPDLERDLGRFAKGKSGNPRGRPRADRTSSRQDMPLLQIDRQLNAFAAQSVPIRRSDKIETMAISEAVLHSTVQTAIKGNAIAQRNLFQQFRIAEERALADAERRERELIDEVRSSYNALKAARDKGEPEPRVLPHPDDLTVDGNGRLILRGPRFPHELERIMQTIQFRDLLLRQSIMEQRTATRSRRDQQHQKEVPGNGALLAALFLNHFLPKRFQRDDDSMVMLLMRDNGKTIRQLLRETVQGYRALGVKVRRGKRLPGQREVRAILEMAIASAKTACGAEKK